MAGPVLTTPTDFVNAALVQIGWKNQIGDLIDGITMTPYALGDLATLI